MKATLAIATLLPGLTKIGAGFTLQSILRDCNWVTAGK